MGGSRKWLLKQEELACGWRSTMTFIRVLNSLRLCNPRTDYGRISIVTRLKMSLNKRSK